MLLDPLPIAASAPNPAYSFAIVKTDGYGTERRDSSTGLMLTITHSKGKSGDRHYVKVASTVDAVNPYTGLTQRQTATVSLSVSVPSFGFTETAMVNLIKALTDTLADADFTATKLLQFQS